jgi:hypothetical protein
MLVVRMCPVSRSPTVVRRYMSNCRGTYPHAQSPLRSLSACLPNPRSCKPIKHLVPIFDVLPIIGPIKVQDGPQLAAWGRRRQLHDAVAVAPCHMAAYPKSCESVHCDAHASCRQSPAVAPGQLSVNPGVPCKFTQTHNSCHATAVLPPQRMPAAVCPKGLAITETNRIHLVVFGMQSTTFGPYLAA